MTHRLADAIEWWSGGSFRPSADPFKQTGKASAKIASFLADHGLDPDAFCHFCLFGRTDLPLGSRLLSPATLWLFASDDHLQRFLEHEAGADESAANRRVVAHRWLRTHDHDPEYPFGTLSVDPLAVLEHLLRQGRNDDAATFARMHIVALELTFRGDRRYYNLHRRSKRFLRTLARADGGPHTDEEAP